MITLILIFFVTNATLATTTENYQFTPTQQTQFHQLTYELRCLVCQNQNLAESNAPLAIDLRNQIANMILANQNNDQIKKFLSERYSDFILYKPPFKKVTLILWLLPFLLLMIGFFILWWMVKLNSKQQRTP